MAEGSELDVLLQTEQTFPPPEEFAAQMSHLAEDGYRPLTVRELVQRHAHVRSSRRGLSRTTTRRPVCESR